MNRHSVEVTACFRHSRLARAAGIAHKGPKDHMSARGFSDMNRLLALLALASLWASPALAGQCQDDIAKIDKALATMELSPDERAQLDDMRNQAVQLCGAGNEQEGIDVTTEAKAMLNIQ
jgi:hypothetical protein